MPRYTAADLLVDLNILAAFWVCLFVFGALTPRMMFLTGFAITVGSYLRRLRRDVDPTDDPKP
jgi:hypothetical protein